MIVRIFSGLTALAILLAITFANVEIFAVVCCVLAILAVNELFNSFRKEGFKPLKVFGFIWCLAIPIISLKPQYGAMFNNFVPSGDTSGVIYLAFFASTVVLFAILVFNIENTSSGDIASTILGTIYIVLSFTCLVLIRTLPGGDKLIWIAFIGAWATDTFAYLLGMAFGKTKILPLVSPKKSLEGTVGGVIGCIIVITIFAIINRDSFNMNIYLVVLLGSLCGIFSQLGDWAMSAFKRKSGIKDFGKFLPGHGGVLDRFDSILFVSPLIYGFLSLFIK